MSEANETLLGVYCQGCKIRHGVKDVRQIHYVLVSVDISNTCGMKLMSTG